MTLIERIEAHDGMTKCIFVLFACSFMWIIISEFNYYLAVPFGAGFFTAAGAFFYYAYQFEKAK